MILKRPIFWFVVFALIGIIAIGYLFSAPSATLSYLGLPSWIYGFFFIEVIFCVLMWLFVKHFWDHKNID